MEDQDDDILLTIETVALFAEECIFYVLRRYDFEWFPPVNKEALRRYSEIDMFTVQIGNALAHDRMINHSVDVGYLTGFRVQTWLQMPVDEARVYVNQHFLHYTFVLPVDCPYKDLLLWCFACYLCCEAATGNRRIFISHVFSQLLQIMYPNYRYFSHYNNLNAIATSYNLLQFRLDNRAMDEGYNSNDDSR